MNACVFLVPLLAVTAVCAAEQEPLAAAIVERYLKLPHPDDDRLGKARQERWSTLSELKLMPDAAVREIARVLPDVQQPQQRMELAEALGFFPTKESAAKLCALLDDPDAWVRLQAVGCLRLMARRVDRVGGQRTQRGGEVPPKVEGLVPHLLKAAGDKTEQNRGLALFALADTLDPAAVAELRRRLSDDSDTVRCTAACLLTEFQDASGLAELRKALERMRSQNPVAAGDSFAVERLLASLERITGKSFGELPHLNPFLDSDSRRAQQSTQRYRELLDAWAAWWAWEPAERRNARQP